MNDFVPGDSFRAMIMRLQNENTQLCNLYKNAVAMLILSAFINILLLAGWIWEVSH